MIYKFFVLYQLGDDHMIKQIAWNTFKKTGDINTFMEIVELENIEKNTDYTQNTNINNKVKSYGEFEDKGNNII